MPPTTTPLWSEDGRSAVLHGLTCSACGLVLFPPQQYGCPGCGAGADRLERADLPAVGRVHSFATVNLHQSYRTPYTVIEVELDAGPLVRALFDPGASAAIDDRVAGRGADGEGGRALVFAKTEERSR